MLPFLQSTRNARPLKIVPHVRTWIHVAGALILGSGQHFLVTLPDDCMPLIILLQLTKKSIVVVLRRPLLCYEL